MVSTDCTFSYPFSHYLPFCSITHYFFALPVIAYYNSKILHIFELIFSFIFSAFIISSFIILTSFTYHQYHSPILHSHILNFSLTILPHYLSFSSLFFSFFISQATTEPKAPTSDYGDVTFCGFLFHYSWHLWAASIVYACVNFVFNGMVSESRSDGCCYDDSCCCSCRFYHCRSHYHCC